MAAPIRRHMRPISGFSLIELLVVTMILSLLGAVSVPVLLAYFERANVARTVSTARTVQASLASFTTSSDQYQYPVAINSFDELLALVNTNGGQLRETEELTGMRFESYTPIDTIGDGDWDSYTMNFRVINVSKSRLGWCITIQPSGVERCPPE